jgi:hypothetical protein
VFSAVFITELADVVGDKWSRENTMVDVQTHLEDFVNMSLRYASFIDEAFI